MWEGCRVLVLPVPGTHPATTHHSSLCVRLQVSPTMTAEELTNQVLEMRNVAASLDIWLTFEALENGELGEHGQVAWEDALSMAGLVRRRCLVQVGGLLPVAVRTGSGTKKGTQQ